MLNESIGFKIFEGQKMISPTLQLPYQVNGNWFSDNQLEFGVYAQE